MTIQAPAPPPPTADSPTTQAAKARADSLAADAKLAREKGNTPEQIEARRRVAKMFAEMHLPDDPPPSPPQREARLAAIDYALPVTTVNGRKVDVNNPKGGFLGMGRRLAYLVSTRFVPQKPEDPIYALEYYPLKS